MEKTGIYEEFKDACRRKGFKITKVLSEIGCSTGVTGGWKAGQYPRLDIAMRIAEYLDISLDELCYGLENSRCANLNESQREWLYIIDAIPSDKQEMCKDFLRTHAMMPPKYKEKTS